MIYINIYDYALFSFFKDRELNPVHYDAKIKFWSETIITY